MKEMEVPGSDQEGRIGGKVGELLETAGRFEHGQHREADEVADAMTLCCDGRELFGLGLGLPATAKVEAVQPDCRERRAKRTSEAPTRMQQDGLNSNRSSAMKRRRERRRISGVKYPVTSEYIHYRSHSPLRNRKRREEVRTGS